MEAKDVAKNLKTFPGAKRRFKENRIGNIITVDDYAHHPTEIKATCNALYNKSFLLAIMFIKFLRLCTV